MFLDPTYLGFRAASVVAQTLPKAALGPLGDVTTRVALSQMRSHRLLTELNQKRVRPELEGAKLDAAVKASFESYFKYWAESFRLPKIPPAELEARTVDVGYQHIAAGLEAGKGAILAMPHLGAWEWASFWITRIKGVKVTAVVEQLDPPELADWFIGLRKSFGVEVVPFGPNAAAACAKALKQNRVLALPCDRDLGGNGIEVEFFGEKTTLPAGPATLALRSGAPLIPATCYFETDGRHLAVALDPLDTERRGKFREDVARVTHALAVGLEELISRAPEQWHLMSPNWPSDHEALRVAGLD